jgi:hypothetical protein
MEQKDNVCDGGYISLVTGELICADCAAKEALELLFRHFNTRPDKKTTELARIRLSKPGRRKPSAPKK